MRALGVAAEVPRETVLDALPAGAPTLVGPIPHTDPADAARFSLALSAGLPVLPTLPRLDPAQSLPGVGLADVPGVRVGSDGAITVDVAALPSVDSVLDGSVPLAGGTSAVAEVMLPQLGGRPVRVPVVGPVTLAMTLRARGVDGELAARLGTALAHRRIAEAVGVVVAAGAVPVPVLMEAGLTGSSHPTFPYPAELVHEMLLRVREAVPGHSFGVHVPGRADLEPVVATGPDLLSLPVQPWVVDAAAHVDRVLAAGGRVAWGAVPVDQPLGTGEELLWRRLSGLWCELARAGVDPMSVRSASLVGPADGLGHFGIPQAELVRDLTLGVARRVLHQTLAARLTIGA